jgi:ribose 5-phosphate isomerase B
MQIYIGGDHAGFELKEHLKKYLEENGLDVVDCGPKMFDPQDDYPDAVSAVAREVTKSPTASRGIVIGLSGQGEALVANKFAGVRAAVYYGGPQEIPRLMREHNDANVLSLGAHFVSTQQAELAVDAFIETQFTHGARHVRRLKKIEEIERSLGL